MTGDTDLSERERDILRLVATGASNKEIAQQLVISPNTVKVHLRNIFAKIEVTSRTEATLYAMREGLVPPPSGMIAVEAQTVEMPAPVIEVPAVPVPTPLPVWRWFLIAALVVLGASILLIALRGTGLLPAAATTSQNTPTASPPQSRWSLGAALPDPRSGMAVVVYEDSLYVIGGETPTGVSGEVLRFDGTDPAWTKAASKLHPAQDVSGVLLGEKIYVPGGSGPDGKPLSTLEVYDPRQDVWEERSPLPEPLSAYAIAAFEGRLYLFGGWNGQQVVASVWEYDPATDYWTKRTPMPTARAWAGAAVIQGKVYVVGGADGNKPLAVNEVYYPQRDLDGEVPWAVKNTLPEPRARMGLSGLADMIYLVGGETSGGVDATTALQYFPQDDIWGRFESPAIPVGRGAAAVQMDNDLVCLGGKVGNVLEARNQSYQAIFITSLPVQK